MAGASARTASMRAGFSMSNAMCSIRLTSMPLVAQTGGERPRSAPAANGDATMTCNALPTTRVDPDLPSVEDVSRRGLLTVTVAVAVFAACGGDDARTAPPERVSRAIDTARGSVEIPVRPERVVCVVNYAMH